MQRSSEVERRVPSVRMFENPPFGVAGSLRTHDRQRERGREGVREGVGEGVRE